MQVLLKFFIITLFFTIFSQNSYAENNKNKLKLVTLLLDWKPNTNHTGFYVAMLRGYYEQNGIQLKILNPAQTTTTALVAMNKANFGITYANDLLNARNANMPVISLAGIIHNDTSCFVWRKSLNIKGIKGLEGKRYGGWGSPEESATLKYIMEKNGADFSKVKMLTIGTQDFLPATLKNVDFTWEYKGWNILAAELKNVSVETYCPSEHFSVFKKPSPLIITNEKMLKEDPETVRAFLKATSMGFEFAIKQPENAARDLKKAVPELDKKLVEASAKFLAPLYKEKGKKWGFQEEKNFEDYANWLHEVKVINKVPKVKEYLNNSYLPE